MPEYKYELKLGQSKPSRGLTADNDADAFAQMKESIKKEGGTYIKDSMVVSVDGQKYEKVSEPSLSPGSIIVNEDKLFPAR